MKGFSIRSQKLLWGLGTALQLYILLRAAGEFYRLAWGTGNWLGEFSLKWGIAFFAFLIFVLFTLLSVSLAFWSPGRIIAYKSKLMDFRVWIGWGRWPIVLILIFVIPIMLQYSPWGVIVSGPYLRLTLWECVIFFIAILLTHDVDILISWIGIITATLLSGSVFAFVYSLAGVSSYPFSLGWSEGNRLWDYSILFGSERYQYSGNGPISAFIDLGRQLIGGLPFLIPGVTLFQVRLWIGIVSFLPYLILGWAAFRFSPRKINWFLAGLWAFIFLRQGPIYPPLMVAAILVAIAWENSLWLAVPLIGAAAYLTQASRLTWIFAPAMWAVMLEFGGGALENGRVSRKTWWRGILTGIAGLAGGVVVPSIPSFLHRGAAGSVSVSQVSGAVSNQPLLWFRLFPNATYPPGILLGLLLAVGPLVAVLLFLSISKRWAMNALQKLALISALTAFGVVGLIVSTKIGGGGDLHNMDMFLIALLFTAAIAWKKLGNSWAHTIEESPLWVKLAMVLLVAIPVIRPVFQLRPLAINDNLEWIAILTDVDRSDLGNHIFRGGSLSTFLDLLPTRDQIDRTLETIQQEVSQAQTRGEVLFIDQRQLLTFNAIHDVILVPEYEKKLVMDSAMGGDYVYFEPFYKDIRAQRFSLIVSELLHERIKVGDNLFGDENNVWVEWVSTPILCYYEPLETFRDEGVQLLVPKDEIEADCPFPFELHNDTRE